ncbi:MAG: RNA polymerase sigma factor [Polyangiales bacterium]
MEPCTLSDEDVVARVLAGELALFEVVMRRHNQRVFRAARSIVKDDAEAEDVMQESYLLAFQHLSDFAGRARFSTWLTRIVVHEALKRVRKGKRITFEEDMDDNAGDTPSGGAISTDPEKLAGDRELARAIEQAVETLPDVFRAVFVLRAVEQMSVSETAQALGVPEDTVKTRLHRARAAIQKQLVARTDSLTPAIYDFHLSRCDRVVDAVLGRLGISR